MEESSEKEVHPLDRDYSIESGLVKHKLRVQSTDLDYLPKLRLAGAITFSIGIALSFISAIVVSNTGEQIKSIAEDFNRFGMVVILLGGVLVVLSYRVRAIQQHNAHLRKGDARLWKRSGFQLLGWNVIAFIIGYVLHFTHWMFSPVLIFYLIAFAMTLSSTLLATAAVMHSGMIRGYAIGYLVGLFVNFMMAPFVMFWSWNGRGWGVQTLFVHFAFVLACGVICAFYVGFVESRSANNQPDAHDD